MKNDNELVQKQNHKTSTNVCLILYFDHIQSLITNKAIFPIVKMTTDLTSFNHFRGSKNKEGKKIKQVKGSKATS